MSKIKDQIKKNKLIQCIWKIISELWDYSKFLLIVAIAILVLPILFYNDLAIYFAKDNYKGEFFKVILTSLGGLGVLYGLYLNSKRIKQGNEQLKQGYSQLKQQEENNTNTRLKDAVTLLGNENPAIVLGGIHTLNQIAIYNFEYKKIVVDVLCSYVREKSDDINSKLKDDKPSTLVQLIIDILFSDNIFHKDIELNLSFTEFKNITFYAMDVSKITNINISESTFYKCRFCNICFNPIVIKNTSFSVCNFAGVEFTHSTLINVKFTNCRSEDMALKFEKLTLMNTSLDNNTFWFFEYTLNTSINLSIKNNTFYESNFLKCNLTNKKDSICNNEFIGMKNDITNIKEEFPLNNYKTVLWEKIKK